MLLDMGAGTGNVYSLLAVALDLGMLNIGISFQIDLSNRQVEILVITKPYMLLNDSYF